MENSKEKQIEEMTMVLTESQHAFDRAWKECLHNNSPMPDRENVFYAKYLVEKKGYRKASEVAEEIFAEIDKQIAFFRMYMFLNKGAKAIVNTLDELKKKYTEEGK